MDFRARIDEAPLSRLQISVIIICFFLNILDGYDVVAIAYAAPEISEQWKISPAQLGIVFSAGLIGMTVGAMFIAPLSDLIGRRTMLLLALAVNCVSVTLTSTSSNVVELIIWRVIVGLTIGSMLASLTSLVAEYAPARMRNFSIGLLQAGYPVGATAGGFLAVWLLPILGWKSVFWFGGAITLAVIPIVYFWLPESIEFLVRRRPKNALRQVNKILTKMKWAKESELPSNGPEKLAGAYLSSLLTTEYRRSTLFLWLSFFMCFFTLYFLVSWIPKIAVNSGFTQQAAISAGTFFNLGAVLGVALLGYLADKMSLRGLIAGFLIIGAVFTVAYGFLSTGLVALLALAFLVGAFMDGGFAGLYAVAARIYPAEIRTTGVGWAIGAGRFGGIAGPYIGGLTIAWNWPASASFALFAAPLVIAAIAVMLIKPFALEASNRS